MIAGRQLRNLAPLPSIPFRREQVTDIAAQPGAELLEGIEGDVLDLIFDPIDRRTGDPGFSRELILRLLATKLSQPSGKPSAQRTLLARHAEMVLDDALHKCRVWPLDAEGWVPSTQTIGRKGEQEVVEWCRCPNCKKKLMTLPPNYPLFDVQCTACSFRAQVKTVRSRPVTRIRGAGWQIMNKVLKAGFLAPPLVVNWTWKAGGKTNRKIWFYPFIPRENLRSYRLSATARQANYPMFYYQGLQTLPRLVLYEKPVDRG